MEKLGKKMIVMISLCLLLMAAVVIPAWADDGGWSQFQYDSHNSGVTNAAGPAEKAVQGWRVQIDHGFSSMCTGANHTPIVSNGKAYVMGSLAQVRALDAKTGQEIWKTDLSCTGHEFQLVTPALGEGKLFTATNDGYVYALDQVTGKILWKSRAFTGDYAQMYTPINYSEGKIYLGSWGEDANKYYCYDGATGKLIWERTATSGDLGYYWSGACVVGDFLIFGDQNSFLTCLNKETGVLVGEIDLKTYEPKVQKIHSTVSSNGEGSRVFFTDEGGHCWVFDLDREKEQLTYKWHKKIGITSNSTPAVYQGRVYVGTGTYAARGDLFCLDENTGNEIWKFALTGESEFSVPGIQASPAISIQKGKLFIYLVTNWDQSQVLCLDENGKKIWDFAGQEYGTFASHTTSSVAVADGWLYFGNDGGWVYALTSPGELAKVPIPSFKDIRVGYWAGEDIDFMVSKGYLKGYENGTFRPENPVTRAEFAALLVRVLGLSDAGGKKIFDDVGSDKWYFGAVTAAYENSLVKGYSENSFAPKESITREQAILMLSRGMEFQGKDIRVNADKVAEKLNLFTDREKASSWAEEGIALFADKGFLDSYLNKTLEPGKKADRAWCAVMLRKIVNE